MVLSPVPSGLRSVWQQGHLLEATMDMADFAAAMPSDRSLLIVEDDKSFLQRLARAMEGRGFAVTTAESVAEGLTQLETASPAFAVVDMRLEDGNGLDVISALKRRRPDARAIILTGYGNIATAVNAVKLGAVDYLSKPVDADDVVAALLALFRRPPAGSTCTVARCNASWPSARRNRQPRSTGICPRSYCPKAGARTAYRSATKNGFGR